MSHENVDGNDFKRYKSQVESTSHRFFQPGIHENATSIDPRAPGTPETSTSLEAKFENLEIQTKPAAIIDNAVVERRKVENSSLSSLGETQSIITERGEGRPNRKTNTELLAPLRTSESQDIQIDRTSLNEDDISDDDAEDELKIAFHKAEINKLLTANPKMTPTLKVHLKALVATYKAVSEFRSLLLTVALYITGNKSQLCKCIELLADFKADRETLPEESIAAYLLRAIANFRLENYPLAIKDCRRVLSLSRKHPNIQEVEGLANHAGLIAHISARNLGNTADELYYGSLYKQHILSPTVYVQGIRLNFPTRDQILESAKENIEDPRESENITRDKTKLQIMEKGSPIDQPAPVFNSVAEIQAFTKEPPSPQNRQVPLENAGKPDTSASTARPDWKYTPSICEVFVPFAEVGFFHTILSKILSEEELELCDFGVTSLPFKKMRLYSFKFPTQSDVITFLDICIREDQIGFVSRFLKHGFTVKGQESCDVGHNWTMRYPSGDSSPLGMADFTLRGPLDIFALLGHNMKSDTDAILKFCQLSDEMTNKIEHSKTLRKPSTFARRGWFTRQASAPPQSLNDKPEHWSFVIALTTQNIVTSYMLGSRFPNFLTMPFFPIADDARIIAPDTRYPLTRIVQLECTTEYEESLCLLSLTPKSFLHRVNDDCQIYPLRLFHLIVQDAIVSARPLKFLLKEHNCSKCKTQNFPGYSDSQTPYEALLQRVLSLKRVKPDNEQIKDMIRSENAILQELARVFVRWDAVCFMDLTYECANLVSKFGRGGNNWSWTLSDLELLNREYYPLPPDWRQWPGFS
ncbi:hypothetical protein TWF694_005817 [Orbilia ellipsospora]|uniref:Uncharacterized protein n=1 Tax=Orbilia ellipsospora TaxID=2528407 RepID=A0AAV9WT38_9PEZI